MPKIDVTVPESGKNKSIRISRDRIKNGLFSNYKGKIIGPPVKGDKNGIYSYKER